MEYTSFDRYMKEHFGGKVYRISLSTGCTCPNRDGSCGTGGCIFCSAGGSGDFAFRDIEKAKEKVASKLSHNFAGYMAYFQSFTNTYFRNDKEFEDVKAAFFAAANHPEVVAVSIATRPDCLPQAVLDMLAGLNAVKPVIVELGLQTIHPETARLINRGYETDVYDRAVSDLHSIGIGVVTHMIAGLPGETEEMMADTLRHIIKISSTPVNYIPEDSGLENFGLESSGLKNSGSDFLSESMMSGIKSDRPFRMADGIKIQLLHVLKDTKLASMIENGDACIHEYSLEEYAGLIRRLLALVPKEMVVHRITGDPPKDLLISPLWTADKKRVLNTLKKALED